MAERIGRLYGLNTLGAGLGALLGGWLLRRQPRLRRRAARSRRGSTCAAAALALTLLPALRRTRPPQPAPRPAPPRRHGGRQSPSAACRLWCLLVFLSGYVIVALEIVWVRLLGQVGQYHAYLFPTVLGIFLLADGLGMAVAARHAAADGAIRARPSS